MLFIPLWLVFSIMVGLYANSKGRSGLGFFFLSLILSPLIGLIVALLVKPDAKKIEQAVLATGENKKCPYCAEIIKREAIVCRFCGREVPAEQKPQESAPYPPGACRHCGSTMNHSTATRCIACGKLL